jgi:hypothetical protein
MKLSTTMDRATTPKKKGSRPNPQHDGWLIHGSVLKFSPEPTIKAVEVKPPSINDMLLGLLDSYHQYAIGTFNTYSLGSTHRSLTDIGGGYNLRGANFSHHTPLPFHPAISAFHLRVLPGLHFNQYLPMTSKVQV